MKIRKLKCWLIALCATLTVVLALLVYFSDFALEEGSRRVAAVIQTRGASLGLGLQNVKFQDASINLNREFVWDNIVADAKLSEKFGFDPNLIYSLLIKQASLRFDAIAKARFSVELKGVSLSPQGYLESSGKISYRNLDKLSQSVRVDISKLRLHFNLGSYGRRAMIEGVKRELSGLLDLVRDGQTSANIELEGRLEFNLGDKPLKARARVRPRDGGVYRLVLDKEDVRAFAEHYAGEVSEVEIDLMAEYPRRLSKLLLLKEYAELKASEVHKKEAVPEDAYRHVLWSYKLTKEFGSDFAKLVTDAHEKGDLVDSGPEHEMDYANNALGREYADSGLEEEGLVGRVLNDPRVVRAAR